MTRTSINPTAAAASANGVTQLDAIMDATVDGIITIDERGAISKMNKAACKIFGYRAGEIIGQNVGVLMPSPYRARHARYIAEYLRTGRAKIIGIGRETVGIRKDGTVFPIELSVSQVSIHGRRSFTGIIRDISYRKQFEKELIEVSEREQRRLGRELRDGLCQELAGVAFLVKTMEQKLQGKLAVDRPDVRNVAALLQAALSHSRRLVRSLHPVDPLPSGLAAALNHLAADSTDAYGISCQFRSPASIEVQSTFLATYLYRIAQECVRSAAESAKASRIVITLSRRNGQISLSISDNAPRRGSNHVFPGKMVHEMIQHRVNLIRGILSIHRKSSGGVKVTCQVDEQKGAYDENHE